MALFGWSPENCIKACSKFEFFICIKARAQTMVVLLLQQFGIIGLGIGLAGRDCFLQANPHEFLYALDCGCVTQLFAIGYATADAFMYLIPAFLCFAISIGVGLGRIMEVSSRRFQIIGYFAVGLVFILVLIIQTWKIFPQVDAYFTIRGQIVWKGRAFFGTGKCDCVCKGGRGSIHIVVFSICSARSPRSCNCVNRFAPILNGICNLCNQLTPP